MSDLPPGDGSPVSVLRAMSAVAALLLLSSCSDPLPADVQWLAGNWRWTGSCCTISGGEILPTLQNQLFINFHYNGDVEMAYHGDTVRTRFDVDVGDELTRVRFLQPMPIFNHAMTFLMERTASDRIALTEHPTPCNDCPDRHGFVRIQ